MQSQRGITFIIAISLLYSGGAIAGEVKKNDLSAPAIVPFAKVSEVVSDHFEGLPDYRAGDLITRQQFEPLLPRLQELGITPAAIQQVVKDLPHRNSFLARELSTPQGRKFMRRIAQYPEAYDRLDRLLQLPDGQRIVRKLVRGPGGEKMLAYLTKAPGGRELGNMLSGDAVKEEFNRLTGKIYTLARLLKRLEQLHAQRTRSDKNGFLATPSAFSAEADAGN